MKPVRRWKGLFTARVAWAAAVLVLAIAVWFGGPAVGRRLSFFRVRQVELVGVRNLAPAAVLGALSLRPGASVFDPTAPLVDRVRRLPGVADVHLVRRLPGALAVVVREVEPVAFVAGPRGLTVVDAAGHALPFDPARTVLDLPVAASADSGVTAVLALVHAIDPGFFQAITGARRIGGGDVELDEGSRRVLVGPDAEPEVIEAVVLVQQDLAAKGRPYAELDARYAGQVVVRRKATS